MRGADVEGLHCEYSFFAGDACEAAIADTCRSLAHAFSSGGVCRLRAFVDVAICDMRGKWCVDDKRWRNIDAGCMQCVCKVHGGCMEGAYRLNGGYMLVVRRVYGGCTKGICWLDRGCMQGVCGLYGGCMQGAWRVRGGCMEGVWWARVKTLREDRKTKQM